MRGQEFDIIRRFFLPLAQGRAEALELSDDAALLDIPAGHQLVVSSDTANAGTHFLPGAQPGDIARKALRSNLSDLAAMGASPLCYQLSIALPGAPEGDWLARFCAALLKDQAAFGLFCSGGDTTVIDGPLTISITAMGLVPAGTALKRSGAGSGDALVLTGPVGDSHIGLRVLKDGLVTAQDDYFINAHYAPRPRLDAGMAVRGLVSAAIDVSDGLLADVGHLCRASGCGVDIRLSSALFSEPAHSILEQGLVTPEDLLSGGEDYELALAVPPENLQECLRVLQAANCRPVVAGDFKLAHDRTAPVRVLDEAGDILSFTSAGWQHF